MNLLNLILSKIKMSEKTTKICDDCEKMIANKNCFICNVDLCNSCVMDLKSLFSIYQDKEQKEEKLKYKETAKEAIAKSWQDVRNPFILQRSTRKQLTEKNPISYSQSKPIYLRIFNKPIYCCNFHLLKIREIAISNKGKIFQKEFGDRLEKEIKEQIKKALILENL